MSKFEKKTYRLAAIFVAVAVLAVGVTLAVGAISGHSEPKQCYSPRFGLPADCIPGMITVQGNKATYEGRQVDAP